MDEKNHQITHRRMVARCEIVSNHGRNNNSPDTLAKLQFARHTVVIVAGTCGIAAGTPLAMLGAIGRSAQLGSIIKGGIYLLFGQFSSAVLLFLRYEFLVATRN